MSKNSIRVSDFLTGKNILGYYQLYNRTQWYSSEEMYNFQLVKLRKLIIHCYNHVPFYNKIIQESGINPYDIKDIGILNQFPVIDKQTILSNYNDFIPTNISSFKRVKVRQTSGTTGQILKVLSDSEARSSVWASFERFYDWMDKKPSDKIINLKGGHVINHSYYEMLKHKLLTLIENKYILNAYDLTESKIDGYYLWLKNFDKPILRGYAQNLYDFANLFKSKGYVIPLKAITTTAEPLMPFHRDLFKEVFLCCTFDQYGCGEIGGVAYECDAHEGLHVSEERVIFETNSNNEIILTDLDNLVFPFIRYKNGDQALLSDAKCSCGRQSLMLKEILGRTSDNVYGPNGNSLHWGFFHHLLIDSGIAVNRNMKKFQVIQNDLNNLEFLLVCETLSSDEKDILIRAIQKVLGEVKVLVREVEDIPNQKSGKYKAIIKR